MHNPPGADPSDGSRTGSESSSDDSSTRTSDSSSSESTEQPRPLPDGNARLHDGSEVTVLTACYLLISFMSDNNIPKSSMRHLWDVLALLMGNDISHNMPPFDEALRMVSGDAGLRRMVYDCCVNDCVIFRDRPLARDPNRLHQHATATTCPVCNEPRRNSAGKARREFSWLGLNAQLAARLWYPGIIHAPSTHHPRTVH